MRSADIVRWHALSSERPSTRLMSAQDDDCQGPQRSQAFRSSQYGPFNQRIPPMPGPIIPLWRLATPPCHNRQVRTAKFRRDRAAFVRHRDSALFRTALQHSRGIYLLTTAIHLLAWQSLARPRRPSTYMLAILSDTG